MTIGQQKGMTMIARLIHDSCDADGAAPMLLEHHVAGDSIVKAELLLPSSERFEVTVRYLGDRRGRP